MKYYINYNPYSWNQYENSTQNSSSNIRYFTYVILEGINNK